MAMPDPMRQDKAGVTYCSILAEDCNTSALLDHFFSTELLVPGSYHKTWVQVRHPLIYLLKKVGIDVAATLCICKKNSAYGRY